MTPRPVGRVDLQALLRDMAAEQGVHVAELVWPLVDRAIGELLDGGPEEQALLQKVCDWYYYLLTGKLAGPARARLSEAI